MNYDIHIENLGALKKADITITPLTILAGENGTGKSFVTKFLYSVLNVINTDIYSDKTTKKISQIIDLINKITNHENIVLSSENSIQLNSFKETLYSLRTIINQEDFSTLESVNYTPVINEITSFSSFFRKKISLLEPNKKGAKTKRDNKDNDHFLKHLVIKSDGVSKSMLK